MLLSEIISLLDAKVLTENIDLNHHIESACGSDMMSDVLAYIKKDAILLTGLINPQVIRTAEMLDIVCLIFVRGKSPSLEILKKAEEIGISAISTEYTMFEACGIMYKAGLKGGRRIHE